MNNTKYKTSKRYKCPYCDYRATRSELIDHVDKKHEALIPEGYNAARTVYDSINGKDHGNCMICKKPVYKWNDKINRYYNLCEDPKCRQKVREIALERHIKVYNKPTLLNDPEQQEKMLANRRISGSYTFSDGVKHTYTGSYEKNALEFIDKVLEIPGKDIQSPGPVLEYEYNGKTHKWITDIYYIPANLLIEIKDGGSNPNNRSMQSYREKQVAKETMVTNLGTFNYIRLTNNEFSQLLNIMADIKNDALNSDTPTAKIHINEEVGGIPPQRPPEAYIIPYGTNNVFDGFAYGDSEMDSIITNDGSGYIPYEEDTFNEIYDAGPKLFYTAPDIKDKINKIHEAIINNDKPTGFMMFAELFMDRKLYSFEEIILSESFKIYDEKREKKINSMIENGVVMNFKEHTSGVDLSNINVVKTVGYVSIHHTSSGYYASTPADFAMASETFQSMDDLEASNVIDIMNDTYKNRFNRLGGESDA